MSELQDGLGRRFSYLRLSVTEACPLRCAYCLPNGYQRTAPPDSELSLREIGNLVTAFAELGVTKVRVTGGEPTVRRDIVDVLGTISRVPGIRKLGLTTNGLSLARLVCQFRAAGVTALNVSVDSLDPARFEAITGRTLLPQILQGVEDALASGFESIKINAVLLKGLTEKDFPGFLQWASEKPVSVRFIELMQTGDNGDYFKKHYLPASEIEALLKKDGWAPGERESDAGPAREFRRPGAKGSIGLIAPYSEGFCQSCNRLRVSCRGGLRLCLFGEKDHSLRPLLQDESQREELKATIRGLLIRKAASHHLHEGNHGTTQNLASIGG